MSTKTSKVLSAEDAPIIERTLEMLHGGQLVEIRAKKGKKTWSGYFYDYKKAGGLVVRLDQQDQPEGIYCTLQRIHEGLIARAPDRILVNPTQATTDNDVIGYQWVLYDFDPVRPAGISASNEEQALAQQTMMKVLGHERTTISKGRILYGCSGNGWHVLGEIRSGDELPQKQIANLAAAYNSEFVTIDKTTYKRSQITKLYGTYARKGFEYAARVWRKSHIREWKDEDHAAT